MNKHGGKCQEIERNINGHQQEMGLSSLSLFVSIFPHFSGIKK